MLLAVEGRAAADEHLSTEEVARRNEDARKYHVALGVADGIVLALGATTLYGLTSDDRHAAGPTGAFAIATAGAFVLGAPLVHALHGNGLRALKSAGFRTLGLLVATGTAVGAAQILNERDCPTIWQEGGGTCALGTLGIATLLTVFGSALIVGGLAVPPILDHLDVKKDHAPPPPRVGFNIVPTRQQTTASFTVVF